MNKGDLWRDNASDVGPVCSKGVLYFTYSEVTMDKILYTIETLDDTYWRYSEPKELLLPLEFLK